MAQLLPPEIWIHIISFLDSYDRHESLAPVSRFFHRAVWSYEACISLEVGGKHVLRGRVNYLEKMGILSAIRSLTIQKMGTYCTTVFFFWIIFLSEDVDICEKNN